MGLDVGDRRIGVAVSDPTGSLARPIEVFNRRDPEFDLQHMIDLAKDYEAVGFVVGLPRNMNGSEGPQAEKTRRFSDALEELGVKVTLWDERLSTLEVERRLSEGRRRKRGPKRRIDDEVAALILQTYLDHLRIRGSA